MEGKNILMWYWCCIIVVVKHFLLFISKFVYINRYHIGYITGDLCPKIFFFINFFKIINWKVQLQQSGKCMILTDICSPDFADKAIVSDNRSWVRLRNYTCWWRYNLEDRMRVPLIINPPGSLWLRLSTRVSLLEMGN